MNPRFTRSARAIALILPALMLTACSSGETANAAVDEFDAQSNRGQAFINDANSDPNILKIGRAHV